MLINDPAPLVRRLRYMHHLYSRAVADLTLEQVNHQERPGVLPLAFSLYHIVQGEDRVVSDSVLNEPWIWVQGGYAERTGLSHPGVRRGTPIHESEALRMADLDAWREYQQAVFTRTEAVVESLSPERFGSVLYPEMPEPLKVTFLGQVIPEGEPVRLGELLEVFLYNHAMRHLGEIEHARSLVGLTGLS